MRMIRSGRWLSRGALVFSVLAAVLGTVAAPSSAGSGMGVSGSCPFTNTLCLFSGTGFTGDAFNVTSLVTPGVCVSLVSHGWGGRAHSAINTNSKGAAMFMNDGCLGDPFQVPGNSSLPDFGGFSPNSVWVPK